MAEPEPTCCTWREILDHNNAMLATQYPKLQMDETLDMMMTIAATRLYFAIRAHANEGLDSTFSPIDFEKVNNYFNTEREELQKRLHDGSQTYMQLDDDGVEKYMQQVPKFDLFLNAKRGGENPTAPVTLRELVDYVRTHCCVRPRRMIDIEGLPLSAAPRLQFGGEWYGEIDDGETPIPPIPNFINRLQNCRYLIEITGVRRFVNFENGSADSAQGDLMGKKLSTDADPKKVQIFIDEEKRAWDMACAIWQFQETQLQNINDFLIFQPAEEKKRREELTVWLSNKAAMFRMKPVEKKYLPKLFHRSDATSKLVFDSPVPSGFKNIPIVDYTAPDEDQVQQLLNHCLGVTRPRVTPIGRVFMHCAGGWGRTGMGLLLLVMTLGDNGEDKDVLAWHEAMQLMYMRYKRQSIAEVAHLLQESIENYDLAAEMKEKIKAIKAGRKTVDSEISLTNGQYVKVSADNPQEKQKELSTFETVKFEVQPPKEVEFQLPHQATMTGTVVKRFPSACFIRYKIDGKDIETYINNDFIKPSPPPPPFTVTYHAEKFSQFELFIQTWLREQEYENWKKSPYRELCRDSGKPAAPTLIRASTRDQECTQDDQTCSSDDRVYALMPGKIADMKNDLEEKIENTSIENPITVNGGRATRRLRVARKRSLRQPRHPRRRCSRRNRQQRRRGGPIARRSSRGAIARRV